MSPDKLHNVKFHCFTIIDFLCASGKQNCILKADAYREPIAKRQWYHYSIAISLLCTIDIYFIMIVKVKNLSIATLIA